MATTGVIQFNVLLCMRELRKQGLLVWIIFGTTAFRTAISFLLIYGLYILLRYPYDVFAFNK